MIRDSELHTRRRNPDKTINSGKCSSPMFTIYWTVLSVAKTTPCGTVDSLTSELGGGSGCGILRGISALTAFSWRNITKDFIQHSLICGPADCLLAGRRSTESRTACLKQQSVYATNRCYHHTDTPLVSQHSYFHYLSCTSCVPSPFISYFFSPHMLPLILSVFSSLPAFLIILVYPLLLIIPPSLKATLKNASPWLNPLDPQAAGDWARNASEVAICLPS